MLLLTTTVGVGSGDNNFRETIFFAMEFFAFSKMDQYTEKRYRLMLFISLTVFFFFVEITVGFKTNSLILIADSFHMLANVAAILVSLLALKFTTRKWSKNTFGWARAEILGALVNAVFLVALCFSITIEAIKRCIKELPILEPEVVTVVGALGLVVNFIGFCLLYEHRTKKAAAAAAHTHNHNIHSKTNNTSIFNWRQAISFAVGDSLGSIIVIVAGLLIWKLNDWRFVHLVDPILTICLVLMMLYSVSPLLRESALILLQTVPTHIEVEAIRKRLLETVADVLEIHEFHVWRLAGDRIIASAHIRCRNLSDYMKIAEQVKEFFHNEGIHSTTIQPEFFDMENCDESVPDFCALDCPVTKEGCVKSTCCQFNNKLNQSLVNLSEVRCQGNVNRGADDASAEENFELNALK